MRILHLLHASAGWEQRAGLTQLRERLRAPDHDHILAAMDDAAIERLNSSVPPQLSSPSDSARPILRAPRRLGIPALAGARVAAICRREQIDMIHAWGVDAAAAARAGAADGPPVVVTLFDPGLSERDIRVLRTVADRPNVAFACSAERVQRRIVEGGIPIERCAIVRPGVDFGALRQVDREALRAELGLPESGMTVLTPDPPSNAAGHAAAIWSILMRRFLDPASRIIVPGVSKEVPELRRLIECSASSDVGVFTESRYRFEDLLAVADYLVIGGDGEISTTALVWAMASSTPIIAPASYAVTEVLSHDVNAILFKHPGSINRAGAMICALYDATENLPRLTEAARGQAFEVCSIRRFADQYRQLYENTSAGRTAATDITDPALDTK